jgi:hypothetical protein
MNISQRFTEMQYKFLFCTVTIFIRTGVPITLHEHFSIFIIVEMPKVDDLSKCFGVENQFIIC